MSRAKGNIAESKIVEYLISKEYKVIERNFYSRFGEIDIIAYKNGIYHFIEVKSGKSFNPIYAITPSKITKIIKTINFFLLTNHLEASYQIDAIILKGDNIEIIENISL